MKIQSFDQKSKTNSQQGGQVGHYQQEQRKNEVMN
jgi:hypothetical protein